MCAESKELWASVVVDVRVSRVDRAFDYSVPEQLRSRIAVGHRVLVPFGSRRSVVGYVVGLTDERPPISGLRPIQRLLDDEPVFSHADLAVAKWMSEHYMCLFVQALQCFLPPGASSRRARPVRERSVRAYRLAVSVPEALRLADELAGRAPRQAEVLKRLAAAPSKPVPAKDLVNGGSYEPLQALVRRGVVHEGQVAVRRAPAGGLEAGAAVPALTPHQERAVAQAREILAGGPAGLQTLLLHGVTGSGKTEVYLRIIAACLEQGRGAIVLVPDISLTPQTLGRFQARFGDRVAVLHSRLSDGERYDEWLRIKRGDAPIVVGARSAVFAPVPRLGVIIIDEEHEGSYKQDETPRYHAREVAEARMTELGGLVVLGSATPSLETFYRTYNRQVAYASLPERVHGRPLPTADVVDMREELLIGNTSMFSRALQGSLAETLSRREQAIILINRRGFASFLLCRECGHVPRCEACGVSLTYHQAPPGLRCHYCGYSARVPGACPQCSGKYLRPFGVGTQRVEQALRELFPAARVARMDRDTMTRKGAHRELLRAFQERRVDVLVGTQMVAKGLDFPGVTLVGVVSADTALHFPDFRAAERTFQLLTQVAGRAGRGEQAGEVILQTYSPDHYAIQTASRHDYAQFVRHELTFRKRTGYPPFARLVRILFTGEDEQQVAKTAMEAAQVKPQTGVKVIGPSPAPLSRLHGKTRWHVLVKGENGVHALAHEIVARVPEASAAVNVAVDVDPLSLL